ncbi:LOG family protein [Chondromyces apiculatus]|uniref:Rossmann fold nucleotide-binding protein n=1 Tax=Chondromyces apiculatus DSM 436 TaxID=1192034 RepID=A0A017TG42_9BACT|nr:hypothetical protein [Chondromyces apiculatus]EYF08268.1 Hypothetical protein CAP_6029 [Chondromyces apiculatus DSM 436]
MAGFDLPYEPIRRRLYTPAELFQGFDPAQPASFAQTADFAIYQHFVAQGRTAPDNPYMGMVQALHDNTITQATNVFKAGRRVAAIMGGHKLARSAPAYRSVAVMARRLTRQGILVCTGGGPGAMEATHLGASLAHSSDSDLAEALAILGTQPTVPALADIVAPSGAIDPDCVAMAHAWFAPAYQVASAIRGPAESLAIPTWHYGHEPTTPFATHTGKYFQNSIREDGLLSLAKQGIIYAEGKAGTIQEIFQDGAQNYYRTFEYFSPMVLFGVQYWTDTYPVVAVLQKLFDPADYAKYVLVTDDVDAAAHFIEQFTPLS